MRKFEDIVPPSRRKDDATREVSAGTKPRSPGFPYATVLTVLVIISASVGALFYFSSAKVEVVPSTASAAAQGSFTASKNSGDLPFELLTVQKVATQGVESRGTKTVSTAASGTVTLYNTQASAQRLVATTRLATPSGLIFRIRSAVTIPAGSQAKPGSIKIQVTADKPGDSYNVGPTSFTVPGLAGTPQAGKVYARSTVAMSGGASGTVPVVDPAAASAAEAALQRALAPELEAGLAELIPAGYALLPGASALSYTARSPVPSSAGGTVDIQIQGTATAVIFPSSALAKAVASSAAGLNYQGEGLTLGSNGDLSLTASGGLPDADTNSFTFMLSGTAPLVYTVDSGRIAAAVSGKSRREAEVALTNYPEVRRAVIILRPFWRQTFPEDPASIRVEVGRP